MAFVVIWEAPGYSQEQFEAVLRPVFHAQPAPAGRLVHLSGPMQDGWRVLDVWESKANADAFGNSDALQQALQILGDQEQKFTEWNVNDVTMESQTPHPRPRP